MHVGSPVKEGQAWLAVLRLVQGNDLVVHKDGEDGSLQERRVEGLGEEGLVGKVSRLVEVLELLAVLLPLLVVLLRSDDEFVVVGKVLHKVLSEELPHIRRKGLVGPIGGVVPLAGLVGVVLIVQVVGALVQRGGG